MSHSMDAFLFSNINRAVQAQIASVETIKTRINNAVHRIQTATADSYDSISVYSIHWAEDDTGGINDCELFIETVSQLQPESIKSVQRSITHDDWDTPLLGDITQFVQSQIPDNPRHLFILHYAGHAKGDSTFDHLIIVPKLGQLEEVIVPKREEDSEPELGQSDDDPPVPEPVPKLETKSEPYVNMSFIKEGLKTLCSRSPGLDILMVMDCCCASVAGRGDPATGARVELMAATSPKGISNSRIDGTTFTQHWCSSFNELLKSGTAFTCHEIMNKINSHQELEQFPRSFVLHEGWEVPITFRSDPGAIPTLPAAMITRTVITAFHIAENPNDESMRQLIYYLGTSPLPMTVLAALPVSSTLLLVQIPAFFQEFLGLPRIATVGR